MKLPTQTMPFSISQVTPKTLADMGLFRKTTNKYGSSNRLVHKMMDDKQVL